ncbi:MAG: response regulator [Planctomycetaceae bacterium]
MNSDLNSSTQHTQITPRVYVLDDEPQVREVIEMQLQAAGYDVVTFSSSIDFLAQVDRLPGGVLISDQRMPDVDGLSLQKHLQRLSHRFQVILLSGFPETRIAVQAMKQGAVTVLDKPYNKDQLLASIEEAFHILNRTSSDENGLPPVLPLGERYLDRLSTREREVIDLVYEGQTNKSISIALDISIKTVEKHRGKAMKKMAVNSLAELIRVIDREVGR